MTHTLPACLRPQTTEERRLARLLEEGTPEERQAEYNALQARFDAMSTEEYDTEPVTRLVCYQGYLVEQD